MEDMGAPGLGPLSLGVPQTADPEPLGCAHRDLSQPFLACLKGMDESGESAGQRVARQKSELLLYPGRQARILGQEPPAPIVPMQLDNDPGIEK